MTISSQQSQSGTHLFNTWRDLRVRLLFEGILVGLISGLLAVAFRISLTKAELWRDNLFTWVKSVPWWGWVAFLAVFASFGILAGWLTGFAPETAGSGIPHVAAVLRRQRQLNWRRVIPIKFIAGVLAIGAGLSLGREGPIVQLGAAAGQAVSTSLVRSKVEEKYLIVCGAGAGLSAAFNAPLAGVIFVLEELQRNFSPYIFGTALVASVAADFITQYFLGPLPTFRISNLPHLPLTTLPLFVMLGLVTGLLGAAFNYTLKQTLSFYDRISGWPSWARPLPACGLAVLVGLFLPQVLGGGHSLAEDILLGKIALSLIPLLFLGKFVLTMVSYGAGVPGGIFLPMLVLGALIGSFYGHLVEVAFPAFSGLEISFAVVAMAAYFTAIVRAPITGTILLVEMTGSYENMLAFLAASLAAYVVAEGLKNSPVYEMLLERDEAKAKKKKLGEWKASTETDLVEWVVESGSKLDGQKVKDVCLPENCLLIEVRRGTRKILPRGNTRLLSGDHIIILVSEAELDAIIQEFFRAVPKTKAAEVSFDK